MMKKSLFSLLIAIIACFGVAMAQNPVTWTAKCEMKSADEGTIVLTGKIADGWHVYGMTMPEDGPSATRLFYTPNGVEFTSNARVAPAPKKEVDDMFGVELTYWEKAVTFRRTFKVTGENPSVVVKVSYMCCNDSSCRPPQTEEFTVEVK